MLPLIAIIVTAYVGVNFHSFGDKQGLTVYALTGLWATGIVASYFSYELWKGKNMR